MANPDGVVEVVFVVVDSTADSVGADTDAVLAPLLFAILLNKVKFFRVNRAFTGWHLLSSWPLPVCCGNNSPAEEICSCASTLGSKGEGADRRGDLG
jgi:hypothetical protein